MATFNEMLEGIQRGEWWKRPWWSYHEYIRIGCVRPWDVQRTMGNIFGSKAGYGSYCFNLEDYAATDWIKTDQAYDKEAMRIIQHFRDKRESTRDEREAFLATVPTLRKIDGVLSKCDASSQENS